LRGELSGHSSEKDRLNERKLAVEKEIERLREDFTKIKSEGLSLDDSQTICPVCKREFENSQEIRSEQIAKFNKDKSDKLDSINERGKKCKTELEGITQELVVVADRIKSTQDVIETTEELEVSLQGIQFKQVIPEEIQAWKELQAQIDELSSKTAYAPQDFSEKLSQINTVRSQISEVDAKLSIQSIIPEREARIEELNNQLKTMAQELATLEKDEFLIQEFTKAKINLAESRINSLFGG
jgi:DNA repair exonuclease SbcCD ATPase subunit